MNVVRAVLALLVPSGLFLSGLASADDQLTLAQQQAADLKIVAEELPELHKDLFFRLPEDEFRERLEGFRRKVESEGKTKQQFALDLARLIAAVGDGHTGLVVDDIEYRLLPVVFSRFRDGVFITEAVDPFTDLVGLKLASLGGRPIEQVFTDVAAFIPHDNNSYLKFVVPYRMRNIDLLIAAGLAAESEAVLIRGTLPDGSQVTRSLPTDGSNENRDVAWLSARTAEPPLYEQNDGTDRWLKRLPKPHDDVLYFKYRRCRDAFGLLGIAGQFQQELQAAPVRKLIVDMRLNGGGNSQILQPMMYLIRQQETINTKSGLFVLIGRRTFSSAVLNGISFRQTTNATLLGEPTGGKPNHFGEVRFLTLPHTGLRIRYSTKYFTHYQDGDPDALMPDVVVEPTFREWQVGSDPVLDAVLKTTN